MVILQIPSGSMVGITCLFEMFVYVQVIIAALTSYSHHDYSLLETAVGTDLLLILHYILTAIYKKRLVVEFSVSVEMLTLEYINIQLNNI